MLRLLMMICGVLMIFMVYLCLCILCYDVDFDNISPVRLLDIVTWKGSSIDYAHNGTYFKSTESVEKVILTVKDGSQKESQILLFVSNGIKLTAMLNRSTKLLTAIGIETKNGWALIDAVYGIDYEWLDGNNENRHYKIDMNFLSSAITVSTEHFKLKLWSCDGVLGIQCKCINRTAYSWYEGLLGDFFRLSYLDISAIVSQWIVPGGYLYSCDDTSIAATSNVEKPSLSIRMEGPFFDNQGFSIVNRHLWLQFFKSTNPRFKVIISPSDNIELNRRPHSVLSHVLRCQLYASQRKNAECPDIVFRNSWGNLGPDWTKPLCNGTKWIQQQPWEFVAIPRAWISFIQQTFQLWVPSAFCKRSYVKNGIDENKIIVIPHGIAWSKYRQRYTPFHFNSPKKSLRILICGGLLPRKGIDIAVKAYIRAFAGQPFVRNVSLVIHSIYGDDFFLQEILEMIDEHAKFPDFFPEIILLRNHLTGIEMIRLFKSVSIFVSPYRSEGFGLLILEAMAAGLPVVVPHHGPALEFTTTKSAFYIATKWPTDCNVYPCGNFTVFKHETMFQPIWGEPDQHHLAKIFQQIYWMDSEKLKLKASAAVEESKLFDWPFTFNHIMKVVKDM